MGKILYMSIPAYGHLNIGITLCNYILDVYGEENEIYFLINKHWERKLKDKNPRFKYIVYDMSIIPMDSNEIQTETNATNNDSKQEEIKINTEMVFMAKIVYETANMDHKDRLKFLLQMFLKQVDSVLFVEQQINKIIEDVKPNLILVDHFTILPFITKHNIPWANILSTNPLVFGMDELPPITSGLRLDQKKEIIEFREMFAEFKQPVWEQINKWLISNNCRPLRPNYFMYESPYFNVYCFPKELDYNVPFPGIWFQMESSIAPNFKPNQVILPDHFEKLPGKLIYFSLGSIFSAYSPILQRILDFIKDIPHKFIVSKGEMGHELVLPENCWGENFVDQKSILSMVDLIISHGGNNTTSECFHFGVPMIIMPICGDQLDNAVRLEETNMGRHLDVIKCTKEELENAINEILNDPQLNKKWKDASIRIQNDNGIKAIVEHIKTYLNVN